MKTTLIVLAALSFLLASFSQNGGAKHVIVDKTTQTLRAYEGRRLVQRSPVSTGRLDQSIPNGRFNAGEKSVMHFSENFDSAMPYSIHVTGDVYLHGSVEVPRQPSTSGSILLPLARDTAKQFYEWIDGETLIEIAGHWRGPSR